MAIYDVTFGGITLPTMQETFSMDVGGDYTEVGKRPMPGTPRATKYNLAIPVYGDPTETDPVAVGLALRASLRSLLEDDATRLAGIQFQVSFDSDLDGWLVVGSANIAYGDGGPSFGDFILTINGAAWLAAAGTLLGLRLASRDLRAAGTPLDVHGRLSRQDAAAGGMTARHYLPVGAHSVLGQAEPRLPDVGTYETLYGPAPYVDGRQHGELLLYERAFADVGKGDVRVWDTRGRAASNAANPAADGWARVYGGPYPWRPGSLPVLDNGVCQVTVAADGTLAVAAAKGGAWVPSGTVQLGYPQVGRPRVVAYSTERVVLQLLGTGKGRRGDVYVVLQRGWQGPAVDVYHYGAARAPVAEHAQVHTEAGPGWHQLRLGVGKQEALAATRAEPVLIQG